MAMAGITQATASLKVMLRYGPYLHECHQLIVEELQKSPSTAMLTRYFERGKMLRSLLVLAAAARPKLTEKDLNKLVKGLETSTAPFSNKTAWTLRKVYDRFVYLFRKSPTHVYAQYGPCTKASATNSGGSTADAWKCASASR
jgi:hypothetical protein